MQPLHLSPRPAPHWPGPRTRQAIADQAHFIKTLIDRPRLTGSVAPSGRFLARAMALPVDPSRDGLVVELGPGTGPVTQALVERGIGRQRLVLVEFDHGFCRLLAQRFPGARVVQGDAYDLPKTLAAVAAVFSAHPETAAVYGDLEFVSAAAQDKVVRFWRAGEYEEKKLAAGWAMPHPTLFLRRAVYDKFGYFRTDLELASDYEFMLRLLKIGHIQVSYLPRTLVRMRAGGRSGESWAQRRKGWRELRRAWSLNGLPVPPLFISRRLGAKLIQYLKK